MFKLKDRVLCKEGFYTRKYTGLAGKIYKLTPGDHYAVMVEFVSKFWVFHPEELILVSRKTQE